MYLVKTKHAEDFLTRMGIPSGRKAYLGDPAKFQGSAHHAVNSTHEAMIEGLKKVTALAGDLTRTEVDRHHAAKQVSDRLTATLGQNRQRLLSSAVQLSEDAQEIQERRFYLNPDKQAVHLAIVNWIKEQAGRPEQIGSIKKEAMKDPEIAAVLYHYPHFLLGMNEDFHKNMKLDCIERFAPEAFKMHEQSIELEDLAGKYERIIPEIPSAFYITSIADKAATRVEV